MNGDPLFYLIILLSIELSLFRVKINEILYLKKGSISASPLKSASSSLNPENIKYGKFSFSYSNNVNTLLRIIKQAYIILVYPC